jgi:twitching motility protein PilT
MASGQDELLFGRLAVHYKLITADQLDEVHALHALAGGRRELPEILVEMNYLTQRQVDQLLIVQRDYLEKKRAQVTAQRSAVVAPGAPGAPGAAGAAGRATGGGTGGFSALGEPGGAGLVAGLGASGAHPIPATAAAAPAGDAIGPAIGREDGATLPPLGAFGRPAANLPGRATGGVTGSALQTPPTHGPFPAPAAIAAPASTPGPAGVAASTGGGAFPAPEMLVLAPPAAGRNRLDAVLAAAVGRGASDIHVHSGRPIAARVNGRLEDLDPRPLAAETAAALIGEVLDPEQREALATRGQVDFAYSLPGRARFRANAYRQQRGTDAVFRSIPPQPPTLAELGLPESLAKLAHHHQGLVLITGPAGCGKSSTQAALIHIINQTRDDHIVTIEDPIEYLHPSLRCVVNQRQVGPHTASFARALRAALREDPDVIAIGELRDLETISLAMTAAETGHLVLGTLHTNNAIRTINRLLGVFPPNLQPQIRTMISESLRVVVSQRLLARADGQGRVPALEVLVATKAVSSLIRDNKTFQIRSALQTGATHGMVQLDTSLADLVKRGLVTREEALIHAEDPARILS